MTCTPSNESHTPGRVKHSKCWDYFTMMEGRKQVQCKTCLLTLTYHKSTTMMNKHLNRKHPNMLPLEDGHRDTTDVRIKKEIKLTIPKVRRRRCAQDRARSITGLLLQVIVKDLRPLDLVNGVAFREFLSFLEPGYSVPSVVYFEKMLEEKYNEVKQQCIAELKKASGLSLSCDVWNSAAVDAYMSVSVHFIDEDWQLRNFLLESTNVLESHTPIVIRQWIEDALQRFEVEPAKIVSMVHDTGENMSAAARLLEEAYSWKPVQCAAHSLQLIVKDHGISKLPALDRAVDVARQLVEYFRKSEFALSQLSVREKEYNIIECPLVVDTPSRWNTTFDMIDRLLELRVPIAAVLGDMAVMPSWPSAPMELVMPQQWDMLMELKTLLEPFVHATAFLGSETHVSASTVPVLVKGLIRALEAVHYTLDGVEVVDSPHIQQLKERVKWQLEERWKFPTAPHVDFLLYAAALDPRFRGLKFLSGPDADAVRSHVLAKAIDFNRQDPSANRDPSVVKPTIIHVSGLDQLFAGFSDFADDMEVAVVGSSDIEAIVYKEAEQYFNEKQTPRGVNPLVWWRDNQSRLPYLSRVAKQVLCLPATSSPADKIFSTAGLDFMRLCTSLHPSHLNMVIYLNRNM
uniref:BED-type domain-containing protein n=1 Tax=Petromyzon marinus TaxID=7757 RepID=S4RUE7_PETMA